MRGPLAAAIRETREETGIVLKHIKYCGLLTETSPGQYNWINYVYLADIAWQSPPPCDEGTLAWIPFEQLAHIPTPKTDWHIYDYIVKEKPFAFNAFFDANLRMLSMDEEIEGIRVV